MNCKYKIKHDPKVYYDELGTCGVDDKISLLEIAADDRYYNRLHLNRFPDSLDDLNYYEVYSAHYNIKGYIAHCKNNGWTYIPSLNIKPPAEFKLTGVGSKELEILSNIINYLNHHHLGYSKNLDWEVYEDYPFMTQNNAELRGKGKY